MSKHQSKQGSWRMCTGLELLLLENIAKCIVTNKNIDS